jgi:hypothetical protein
MEAARSAHTLVFRHITKRRHNPEGSDLIAKFHPEDGDSMVLRNVGILPHKYTALQPRRLRLEMPFQFMHLYDEIIPSGRD